MPVNNEWTIDLIVSDCKQKQASNINKQIFIVLQELDKYNHPTLHDGTKDV